MEPASNFYVYKLTTDNGGAPCVRQGLLTLAICKPTIRRVARHGDLLFGFGGRNLGDRLIYVAVVTGKIPDGSYYWDSRYAFRADRIYERIADGTARLRARARYHTNSDERMHDVGIRFERAQVLLSTDFRYFGADGTVDYRLSNPAVAKFVGLVGRGHRVKYPAGVREDLLSLKDACWRHFRSVEVGKPTDQDLARRCNTGSAPLVI